MANTAVIRFNAGELSPLIDARTDVTKYSAGCRTLENMIPSVYGAAIRRPGTKFVHAVKTSSLTTIIVPFEYSTSVSYILEFGNLYVRFYTSGGILLDGVTPVETVTPYLTAELYQLQFKQVNDVMWITHPDHFPYKLQRTSATTFTMTQVLSVDGPFLTRNDLDAADGVTMTPAATTGDTTLTASSATFVSGHVGSLFKLTQPRTVVTVELKKIAPATGVSSSLSIKGAFTFYAVASSTWDGSVSLERCADGTNWESVRTFVDRSVDYTGNETDAGVTYRMNVTVATGGTISCTLTIHSSTQEGVCRVESLTSSTVANVVVLSDFASTGATTRWAEGSWNRLRGFPKTMTFLGERAIYAGTSHEPQTVWFSKVDDYENFDVGTTDDESFSVPLASDQRNAIEWIASLENLIVGTSGGEWRIRASGDSESPLTPTDYNIRQQSYYGSAPMQAITGNDSVFFVDRARRKLREMMWQESENKYNAPDITVLCEHITKGGVIDFAWQRNPEPILWCVLASSPYLISLTVNREQDVIAAAAHPLGGSGIVESVAVIPGSEEDEVWVVVQRTIDGAVVRYVEQMQPRAFATQADAFFVDCGATYDGASATTISSGLSHIEGETVTILGDGVTHETEVVASGAITLDTAVVKAQIGLPYTYKLKPMRLDASSLSRGSQKQISQIILSFNESLGVEYGLENGTMYDVFEDILQNKYGLTDAEIFACLEDVLIARYGAVAGPIQFDIDWPSTSVFEALPLFTGDVRLVFDGGHSELDDVLVTGDSPLPCTVTAMVVVMDAVL